MEKLDRKTVPILEDVKAKLISWAENNHRITKVYLFGSYITKVKNPPRDIDIAIKISSKDNDTAHGFWCSEARKMEQELSRLLSYEVDLEWFDGNRTVVIQKGLEVGNIIVYEKEL